MLNHRSLRYDREVVRVERRGGANESADSDDMSQLDVTTTFIFAG